MSFYHVKSILYQTFQKEDRIFSYSHLTQNVAKTPSVTVGQAYLGSNERGFEPFVILPKQEEGLGPESHWEFSQHFVSNVNN